jgi:heme-degrading monooxygenase HmoA
MHARLNIRQILPGKVDEFLSTFQRTVAPDVRQRQGYKGGLLLTDRSTGKAISLTLWETEADMRAVEVKGLLPVDYTKTAHLVAGPVAVERYEVNMQD